MTFGGLASSFRSDISDDLVLIQLSVCFVGFYAILFLGSCSPIHCRATVAIVGLLCVGIAYVCGFSVMLSYGWEIAGVHNLMPFLLIGIGVDDMFVICNAID